ncbi:MAG: 16S rRNA (uracil(1498)-N(3))-methyltransferase [Planctomycetaceae bacterium]|nr:16S rRNA (uracil(1498)-N(3))-methyltransferase [Planctomycetaceae bacterium]
MADMFYCPNLTASPATLTGQEAHHAINVLRLKVGDAADIFDGCGHSAQGRVVSLSRREVAIEYTEVVRHESPPRRLTVAAAIPKGDRLKWMVEKLAELGVHQYVPLLTQRSVVKPGQNKLDKLAATVVSAAKQSRNYHLLSIAPPITLTDLLSRQQMETAESARRLFIAHPDATAVDTPATSDGPTDTTLLIGPEGGFTDGEVRQVEAADGQAISWSGGILRIETAAIVFAAELLRPSAATSTD